MAGDKYFNSSGSNTSPYESAATGATNFKTLVEATSIWTAGEKLFAQYDQYADFTANTTITADKITNNGNVLQVVSVSDITNPTTRQIGFSINTTGNYYITLAGLVTCYGITFYPGGGGSAGTASRINFFASSSYYNEIKCIDCVFNSGYTSTSFIRYSYIGFSSATAYESELTLINCTFYATASNVTNVMFFNYGGNILIDNLILAGSYTSNLLYLFDLNQYFYGITRLINSDLSAHDIDYIASSIARGGKFYAINDKFHANTQVVYSTWDYVGLEVYIIDCYFGTTYVRYQRQGAFGIQSVDTGVYLTTGSMTTKDGLPCSLRLDSDTNNCGYTAPLQTEWFSQYLDGGTEVTLSVEVLVGEDGSTHQLTTRELWLELCYMNDSADTVGTCVDTKCAVLATASNVAAGSGSWTGDGYAAETTHKLEYTFTPNFDGNIKWRVCLAKPNTTIFINPPTVS